MARRLGGATPTLADGPALLSERASAKRGVDLDRDAEWEGGLAVDRGDDVDGGLGSDRDDGGRGGDRRDGSPARARRRRGDLDPTRAPRRVVPTASAAPAARPLPVHGSGSRTPTRPSGGDGDGSPVDRVGGGGRTARSPGGAKRRRERLASGPTISSEGHLTGAAGGDSDSGFSSSGSTPARGGVRNWSRRGSRGAAVYGGPGRGRVTGAVSPEPRSSRPDSRTGETGFAVGGQGETFAAPTSRSDGAEARARTAVEVPRRAAGPTDDVGDATAAASPRRSRAASQELRRPSDRTPRRASVPAGVYRSGHLALAGRDVALRGGDRVRDGGGGGLLRGAQRARKTSRPAAALSPAAFETTECLSGSVVRSFVPWTGGDDGDGTDIGDDGEADVPFTASEGDPRSGGSSPSGSRSSPGNPEPDPPTFSPERDDRGREAGSGGEVGDHDGRRQSRRGHGSWPSTPSSDADERPTPDRRHARGREPGEHRPAALEWHFTAPAAPAWSLPASWAFSGSGWCGLGWCRGCAGSGAAGVGGFYRCPFWPPVIPCHPTSFWIQSPYFPPSCLDVCAGHLPASLLGTSCWGCGGGFGRLGCGRACGTDAAGGSDWGPPVAATTPGTAIPRAPTLRDESPGTAARRGGRGGSEAGPTRARVPSPPATSPLSLGRDRRRREAEGRAGDASNADGPDPPPRPAGIFECGHEDGGGVRDLARGSPAWDGSDREGTPGGPESAGWRTRFRTGRVGLGARMDRVRFGRAEGRGRARGETRGPESEAPDEIDETCEEEMEWSPTGHLLDSDGVSGTERSDATADPTASVAFGPAGSWPDPDRSGSTPDAVGESLSAATRKATAGARSGARQQQQRRRRARSGSADGIEASLAVSPPPDLGSSRSPTTESAPATSPTLAEFDDVGGGRSPYGGTGHRLGATSSSLRGVRSYRARRGGRRGGRGGGRRRQLGSAHGEVASGSSPTTATGHGAPEENGRGTEYDALGRRRRGAAARAAAVIAEVLDDDDDDDGKPVHGEPKRRRTRRDPTPGQHTGREQRFAARVAADLAAYLLGGDGRGRGGGGRRGGRAALCGAGSGGDLSADLVDFIESQQLTHLGAPTPSPPPVDEERAGPASPTDSVRESVPPERETVPEGTASDDPSHGREGLEAGVDDALVGVLNRALAVFHRPTEDTLDQLVAETFGSPVPKTPSGGPDEGPDEGATDSEAGPSWLCA